MDGIIAIVWIIGFLIGCIITAWTIGAWKAKHPNEENGDLAAIFVIISMLWPIMLTLVCILCPFWLIGRFSQHHYEKKIQKEDK